MQSAILVGTFDSLLGDGGAALTSLLTEAVHLLSTSQGRASVQSKVFSVRHRPREIFLSPTAVYLTVGVSVLSVFDYELNRNRILSFSLLCQKPVCYLLLLYIYIYYIYTCNFIWKNVGAFFW